MGKVALCAAILLAAGLLPVLQGWQRSLCSERRAILEILENHPKLQLKNLSFMDSVEAAKELRYLDPAAVGCRSGLRLEVRFHGDDVRCFTAFRKDLKVHPLLSKRFDNGVQLGGCGWRVADPSEDPAFVVLELFLIERAK